MKLQDDEIHRTTYGAHTELVWSTYGARTEHVDKHTIKIQVRVLRDLKFWNKNR